MVSNDLQYLSLEPLMTLMFSNVSIFLHQNLNPDQNDKGFETFRWYFHITDLRYLDWWD